MLSFPPIFPYYYLEIFCFCASNFNNSQRVDSVQKFQISCELSLFLMCNHIRVGVFTPFNPDSENVFFSRERGFRHIVGKFVLWNSFNFDKFIYTSKCWLLLASNKICTNTKHINLMVLIVHLCNHILVYIVRCHNK